MKETGSFVCYLLAAVCFALDGFFVGRSDPKRLNFTAFGFMFVALAQIAPQL